MLCRSGIAAAHIVDHFLLRTFPLLLLQSLLLCLRDAGCRRRLELLLHLLRQLSLLPRLAWLDWEVTARVVPVHVFNINEKLKISNDELKLTAQSLPSFHDCGLSQVAFLEPPLDGCCRRGPPAICGNSKMDDFEFFSSSNRWFGRGCGAGCDDLRRLVSWSLVQGEGAIGGLWSRWGGSRLDHLVDQLVVVVVVVVVHLVDQLVAGVLQVVVQLDTLVGSHLVCKMIEVDQIYVKMISK